MVIDCIRVALRNLVRHGTRTLLTMTGIIIGTCSVIAVFSVGYGGKEEIVSAFQSFGFDGLIVSAPSGGENFTKTDIEYIRQNIDEITASMPFIYDQVHVGLDSGSIPGFALGVGDSALTLASTSAKYGRGFTRAELSSGARVCMIDSELAQKIYYRENIVGKTVTVNIAGGNETFTVIGVISKSDSAIGSIINNYVSNLIYIPYQTYADLSGNESFSSFIVSFREGTSVDMAWKKIRTQLEVKTNITGYGYENLSQQQQQVDGVVNTVTLIISAIAAVSLVVGGLGVMTIMLVAVNERKSEIGIKKAIGASRGHIMSEFMVEALAISMLGGLIGILLGYLLSLLSKPLLGFDAVFNVNISIFALLFCAVIGIIFSVYPAKKAAGLDPIDCLRASD